MESILSFQLILATLFLQDYVLFNTLDQKSGTLTRFFVHVLDSLSLDYFFLRYFKNSNIITRIVE